jgi:hypothetical protein
MFTNALSDQLNGSFEELMQEIRAMRRELERVRIALEAQGHAKTPPKVVRTRRPAATRTRTSAA